MIVGEPHFNLRSGVYFYQGSRLFVILEVWEGSRVQRCEFINPDFLNERGEVDEQNKVHIIKKTKQEMELYMDENLITYIGTTKPRY